MKKLINLKNLINIRNLIIVVLCLTIIALGIGFAFLSIELEKRSNEELIFDVSITNVKQNTSIKGGTISPTAIHTITDNQKTISTHMNLYAPYDEISYTITIENKGTLPAKIVELIEYPNYTKDSLAKNTIAPVEITYLDITDKILKPQETLDLNIVASYKPTINVVPKSFTYQLSVIAESTNEE